MGFALKTLKSILIVLTFALILAACGVQPVSTQTDHDPGSSSGSTATTDSDGQPIPQRILANPIQNQTPIDYSGGGTEEEVL